MNDQDHSLSLSDPDRSLVLSHLLTNFLQNLASCHTALRKFRKSLFFLCSIYRQNTITLLPTAPLIT
jgi:hypothetical protein